MQKMPVGLLSRYGSCNRRQLDFLVLNGLVLLCLLELGLTVHPAQVSLPANGDDAAEQGAVLERNEREVERHGGGPDLPRVLPAARDGVLQALDGAREALAGQQGLHAEKVRWERDGKGELVEDDLGGNGQRLGLVVEVASQHKEPNRDGC